MNYANLVTNKTARLPGDLALPPATATITGLRFAVYGKPAAAGSKRGFAFKGKDGKTHVAISDANKNARPWKSAVTDAALQEFTGAQFTGPVKLEIVFWIQRPKGHYGSGKNAGVVKASAPERPTGKPDLLKLARGVEDAITDAGVWRDDAQVVIESLEKRWSQDGGYRTDVTITAREESC